jgi:hypothetical protein
VHGTRRTRHDTRRRVGSGESSTSVDVDRLVASVGRTSIGGTDDDTGKRSARSSEWRFGCNTVAAHGFVEAKRGTLRQRRGVRSLDL